MRPAPITAGAGPRAPWRVWATSLLWHALSLSILVSLLLLAQAVAQNQVARIPPLTRPVTDLTVTLSVEQAARLEAKLREFESRKGSQIAVLIVSTTQPETIEQYALRVAEQWKIGRAKVDDGAILVVAKDDRTLRIDVGYGLEGALNDATSSAGHIADNEVAAGGRAAGPARGAGSGSPSMTFIMLSTPASMPPAKSPCRKRGAMISSMMRLLVASFSAPSSP